MADEYTNTENDNFPGARERTRPGTAPGEMRHEPVLDATGRPVSGKPANRAMLAGQKARLEREKLKEQQNGQPASSGSILPRLFVFALFIPLLSHFLTGTYHFGLAPTVEKHARRAWRSDLNPFAPEMKEFTTAQLAQFDGSDPSKPIYLSVMGEVFDVSANPRMYGPGGAYSMMAGRDASRAFITGCFETHLTHDLRGLSPQELLSLQNWNDFFRNSKKYHKVGKVILPRIDPQSPIPPPCNVAAGEEAPAHHRKDGSNNPHAKGK